jgi:hypothetical protein
MALDADEVVIGSNGRVYVAPVGTTGPTDIATALNASFVDLGYASEDGVSFTPSLDTNEIRAWQSFYPVRRAVTSRSFEIGVTLLQWNTESLQLAFGGGSVAVNTGISTYTPPDPEDLDYRAMVVTWQDGDKDYRMHFPKVLVTDVGDITIQRSDPAGIELTFAVEATDGTNPFTLISDDPAIVAS